MQVTCDGGRLMAVKGGIKSGLQRNAGNFSYEFQIPGRYQFVRHVISMCSHNGPIELSVFCSVKGIIHLYYWMSVLLQDDQRQ